MNDIFSGELLEILRRNTSKPDHLGGNFAGLGIDMLERSVLYEVRYNTGVRNHVSNGTNPD